MFTTTTEIILAVTYFLILYFTVFWLLVLLDKREVSRIRVKHFPLISIIIPAYNEERTIRKCLQSVLALDYPALEIVVVNDGSRDKTGAIVDEIRTASPIPLTLVNQPNKGKGAALNVALEHVHGEFYATLDADSMVEPHVLKRLLPYFVDDSVACVLPPLKIKDPTNMLQRIQRYEYIINMFHKMLNSMLEAVHVAPGPFSVFRTSVVKRLGNYDEKNITEDLEIALRLQKHHYKIIQTGEAAVYTLPPDNLRDLYKQRNRWYKGAILNSYQYKSLMFKKEYGDFGAMRLPTVILGGILSIVVLLTLTYDFADATIRRVVQLSLINFDIITLIRNWSLNFNLLDLRYLELFVVCSVMALGIFVMIASFRYCQEKITRYGKTFASLVSYMFLYSFIISFVWLMIGIEIVRGKVQKW